MGRGKGEYKPAGGGLDCLCEYRGPSTTRPFCTGGRVSDRLVVWVLGREWGVGSWGRVMVWSGLGGGIQQSQRSHQHKTVAESCSVLAATRYAAVVDLCTWVSSELAKHIKNLSLGDLGGGRPWWYTSSEVTLRSPRPLPRPWLRQEGRGGV